MNIVETVKALNFPDAEYVVVSGGTLAVLGIRETRDIDIAITSTLYTDLCVSGEWEEKEPWSKLTLEKLAGTRNGIAIEIIPEIRWEAYTTPVEEIIASALVVDSIPFMNLDELIKFKHALGRPKDMKDIKRIEQYLAQTI